MDGMTSSGPDILILHDEVDEVSDSDSFVWVCVWSGIGFGLGLVVLFTGLAGSTLVSLLGAGVGLAGSLLAVGLESWFLIDIVEATTQDSPSAERSGVCGDSVDMAPYTYREGQQCSSGG